MQSVPRIDPGSGNFKVSCNRNRRKRKHSDIESDNDNDNDSVSYIQYSSSFGSAEIVTKPSSHPSAQPKPPLRPPLPLSQIVQSQSIIPSQPPPPPKVQHHSNMGISGIPRVCPTSIDASSHNQQPAIPLSAKFNPPPRSNPDCSTSSGGVNPFGSHPGFNQVQQHPQGNRNAINHFKSLSLIHI